MGTGSELENQLKTEVRPFPVLRLSAKQIIFLVTDI
jgi:hypothetical protein